MPIKISGITTCVKMSDQSRLKTFLWNYKALRKTCSFKKSVSQAYKNAKGFWMILPGATFCFGPEQSVDKEMLFSLDKPEWFTVFGKYKMDQNGNWNQIDHGDGGENG